MTKRICLSAFEVLVEYLTYNQEISVSDNLKTISDYYNTYFKTNEFQEALEKTNFYKNRFVKFEENLFIEKKPLPFILEEEKIIGYRDRLLIFITIYGWKNKFKLAEEFILDMIHLNLRIEESDFQLTKDFFSTSIGAGYNENLQVIAPNEEIISEKLEGEWVDHNAPKTLLTESVHYDAVDEKIKFAYYESYNAFIIGCSTESSKINKNGITTCESWEMVSAGEEVSINSCASITYRTLKNKHLQRKYNNSVSLSIRDIGFQYNNNKVFKNLNLQAGPGKLIGIIGQEGSGKSTLLKVLAGVLKPTSGKIFINGTNLDNFNYQLKGVIGYVPEENILFDELTVFENLFLSARLYLGNYSKSEIRKQVELLINELQLSNIKNTVVGTQNEKNIQPGQRHLLNIAFELLRDPEILFIDNSLAPLSKRDSDSIIQLLSKYSLKGKLIITNIVEGSASSFRHFDDLIVLDQHANFVYQGPKEQCISYLCQWFPPGITEKYLQELNMSANTIINLINEETDLASPSRKRYCSPSFLNDLYKEHIFNKVQFTKTRKLLPGTILAPPTLDKQYLIYSIRNFKTKLANKRDLLFTILVAPVIALIISLALRTSTGEEYSFSINPNIPMLFYLSIIINLFLGLSQAANELIKEQNTLQKEQYLNLSKFSYINSKITYLLTIVFAQSFLYTAVCNSILEVEGMVFIHWLIYSCSSSFGVFLGLLFSSVFKSTDTIYQKAIPIIIMLQLVLGGGIISLEKLSFSKNKYTPVISELIVSKLAYESLMIEQFKNNPYSKTFYALDRDISRGAFAVFNLIPVLESHINFCNDYKIAFPDSTKKLLASINTQFNLLSTNANIFPFEYNDALTVHKFSNPIAHEALEYLRYLDLTYYKLYKQAMNQKEYAIDSLERLYKIGFVDSLKNQHYNYSLASKVLNNQSRENIRNSDDGLIQVTDPIYQSPTNKLGRTMLFIPTKNINDQAINTTEYNLTIIWLLNLIFYLFILNDGILRLKTSLKRIIR